ncbi:MAG: hypothetical protein RL757_1721 [Bacteroidota bacterium]|jgi:protein TonB
MFNIQNLIIISICLFLTNAILGQTTPLKRDSSFRFQKDSITGDSSLMVEVMPEFPMGKAGLMKFLSENIHYPKASRDADAQGTVYIGFGISSTGHLTNVRVLNINRVYSESYRKRQKEKKLPDSAYEPLGVEAMRVVKTMPDWLPGTQNGRAVNVNFTLPVRFRLE